LAILPTLVGVGVVVLMADGKGRDAVSGEIKGKKIKDEGAVEAGAEPKQNGSCKVDIGMFRMWVGGPVTHLADSLTVRPGGDC